MLSRYTVVAGPSVIELVNFGQDAHDLRLERRGGTRIYGTPEVQPGGRFDLPVRLLPGTYELWCRVANHPSSEWRACSPSSGGYDGRTVLKCGAPASRRRPALTPARR